jgi:hypothetical protein
MLVREGSRVRWIEKTQRKMMVCGVEEGIDRHHVSFSSIWCLYFLALGFGPKKVQISLSLSYCHILFPPYPYQHLYAFLVPFALP